MVGRDLYTRANWVVPTNPAELYGDGKKEMDNGAEISIFVIGKMKEHLGSGFDITDIEVLSLPVAHV